MGFNSKGQKTNANDGISSFPDEIIGQILSFLPTKCAVATSLLSKRWRYLWTNLTSLSFGSSFPSAPDDERFHDFVDRVLHRCASKQIRKFSLGTQNAKFNRVQEWVDEALRRDVNELKLNLVKFPAFVSTCRTLTVLKLLAHKPLEEFEFPASFNLPSLRILSLEYRCPSTILWEKLFRGCPALEDLNVWAWGGDMEHSSFIVSAPVLKRLRFKLDAKIVNCRLVIDAPNLEYMYSSDGQTIEYEVRSLSSIAEAFVNFGDMYNKINPDTRVIRALELLQGLKGVKFLSFGNDTLQVLEHAYPHQLPIFCNMIKLDLLFRCGHPGGKILHHLLEVSPRLKVLILNMGRSYSCWSSEEEPSSAPDWSEPQSLPECLSYCLELVQIEQFFGNGYELRLVEYLLMHAAVLKKLTIEPVKLAPETKVKLRQKLEKLLEFPRISETCQIHFLGWRSLKLFSFLSS